MPTKVIINVLFEELGGGDQLLITENFLKSFSFDHPSHAPKLGQEAWIENIYDGSSVNPESHSLVAYIMDIRYPHHTKHTASCKQALVIDMRRAWLHEVYRKADEETLRLKVDSFDEL